MQVFENRTNITYFSYLNIRQTFSLCRIWSCVCSSSSFLCVRSFSWIGISIRGADGHISHWMLWIWALISCSTLNRSSFFLDISSKMGFNCASCSLRGQPLFSSCKTIKLDEEYTNWREARICQFYSFRMTCFNNWIQNNLIYLISIAKQISRFLHNFRISWIIYQRIFHKSIFSEYHILFDI